MAVSSKKVRVEEVAERAGVSTATVSRYFNTPEKLSATAATKVREAVDALGYVPNLMAGALASNRSRLVSLLVPNLADSIFAPTIEAMVWELAEEGLVVMLGVTDLDQKYLLTQINAALTRRADAIIVMGNLTASAAREELERSDTTIIETWGLPSDPIDVAIGFSHEALGAEIASYMHDQGYRRPHLITAASPRARRRSHGIVDAWKAMTGVSPTESELKIPLHFGQARDAFENLQRITPRPDVVVCGSDMLAQGIIMEAQAAGLKVPEDIAVIGFGNARLAADMRPSITTISIDGARIAQEAAKVLRKRALGQTTIGERQIDIGFELLKRDSA